MSANWELQLLSSCIQAKEYRTLIDRGISGKHFYNLEARALYNFLTTYYNTADHYGEVASLELIRESFPRLELPTPQQSLSALCAKVKSDALKRTLKEVMSSVESLVDTDPESALLEMQKRLGETTELYADVGDVFFEKEAVDTLKSLYDAGEGSGGLSWPWPELTKIAGPIEPGTLNIIYGIPKSQKTWIALLTGTNARNTQNARVLVYSREMSMLRLMKRVACLLTQTSYERFCDSKLSQDEYDCLFGVIECMREESENPAQHAGIIFTKGMNKTDMALPILRRKIEIYKPDLVILDSAYQLAGDSDWKKITQLTQGLKGIADDTGVPIIAVTQENERSAYQYTGTRGTASIAQSPSWAQDADILIRCIKKDDKLSLHIGANRERKTSGAKGIRIYASPADNYTFIDTAIEDYGSNDKSESDPIDDGDISPVGASSPFAKLPIMARRN